ncbi:MAG: 6-phosphofructokinase [Candidatus Omnitrophica bacterium]|nr:6-phosphofructokinase [Candidatus Omnitrophota bacterium]
MKRIGILTSGGDAPGMNAAIRSTVRSAIHHGFKVKGILRGYEGLINDEVIDMNARSVSNILTRGGTMLKTARSSEFMTKKGRKKAYETVKKNDIDGLIIIGGNGSFQGAHVFWKEFRVPSIGVPATIDNDISGSDYTIGAHTAVNTALDAIDKIRDTVTSMERIYVIEVMGREDPFIATRVGLAGGAEEVIFPHSLYSPKRICSEIIKGRKKGKISWIIVVSEGSAKAQDVADIIKKKTKFSVRALVLGHIQRGGSPEAFDRILASILGASAVDAIAVGRTDAMVGFVSQEIKVTSYAKAVMRDAAKARGDRYLYRLTKILAK